MREALDNETAGRLNWGEERGIGRGAAEAWRWPGPGAWDRGAGAGTLTTTWADVVGLKGLGRLRGELLTSLGASLARLLWLRLPGCLLSALVAALCLLLCTSSVSED